MTTRPEGTTSAGDGARVGVRHTGLWNGLRYGWRTQRWAIVTGLLAVAAAFAYWNPWTQGGGLWAWLEPVLGAATLAVAVAIWLGELREEHERTLPKRLTAVFEYGEGEQQGSGLDRVEVYPRRAELSAPRQVAGPGGKR